MTASPVTTSKSVDVDAGGRDALGRAGEGAHVVAGGAEAGQERGADVAAGAGDEDAGHRVRGIVPDRRVRTNI